MVVEPTFLSVFVTLPKVTKPGPVEKIPPVPLQPVIGIHSPAGVLAICPVMTKQASKQLIINMLQVRKIERSELTSAKI